jgi:hypothetical protein
MKHKPLQATIKLLLNDVPRWANRASLLWRLESKIGNSCRSHMLLIQYFFWRKDSCGENPCSCSIAPAFKQPQKGKNWKQNAAGMNFQATTPHDEDWTLILLTLIIQAANRATCYTRTWEQGKRCMKNRKASGIDSELEYHLSAF